MLLDDTQRPGLILVSLDSSLACLSLNRMGEGYIRSGTLTMNPTTMSNGSDNKPQQEREDESLLRSLVPCEEDRRLYRRPPWRRGEYRWYRSSNVVDLESYRRRRSQPQQRPAA